MASTNNGLPFVQQTYKDNWTRGYPGQVADAQTYLGEGLATFPAEDDIVMGRGVVQAVQQPQSPTDASVSSAPFSVTNPDSGTVAADLVGVAIRPNVTTTNIRQIAGDTSSPFVAGYPAKDFVAVLPFGSNRQVIVYLIPGTTVAVGQPVYIAIDVNTPLVPVGDFYNSDAGEPANFLLVPNAIWYTNTTSATDFTVATIKLNSNQS